MKKKLFCGSTFILFIFTTVCTSLVLHDAEDSFELHQRVDVEDVRQMRFTVLKDGIEQEIQLNISPSQLIDSFNDYPPSAIKVIPDSELLPPTVKIRIDLHENGSFIELNAYQERYWVIRTDVEEDGPMYTLEEETRLTDFMDGVSKLEADG